MAGHLAESKKDVCLVGTSDDLNGMDENME